MAATSDRAAVRELESRLRRPDRGENGFREGAETRTRLETLQRLREFAEEGKIKREGVLGGINTHVHTSKSFGYFESPSEAVWHAYLAKIIVFGINDHYTLAGHEEFGKACRVAGIRPAFSLEAIAQWEEAAKAEATVNDTTNPGRTYLTAKGVSRTFAPGSQGEADLTRMNAALLERNQKMTQKLAKVVASRLGEKGAVAWQDVLALTPHGQPTERHIALVLAKFLERTFAEPDARKTAVKRLVNEDLPDAALQDPAAFQDFLRTKLLKAGGPAYVEESKSAFIPVERMVTLALDLGAIPTYPVMGDPVSPWEEDLERLYDRLEALGIHAVEVIPDRNTRERLSEIVKLAAERSLPVFNGTEHNTKMPMPLVDKFFFDDEFRPHFERGARVLLGHQALRAAGKDGYVLEDGTLPPGDREANLKRLEEAGRRR
ncbi:MAG TPA: hypothetical protein VMT52_08555 [Planctomycetota bacterium]|nr:hypothetical protein [Planctomycetota bacterium]